MAIILRSSKSVPLTFTEMDGNFSELNARATTLEGAHIKNVNGVTTSSAQDNAITLDTDDISEGSTNQYFTNARSRSAISVTDAGGDGSLSYNSTTGVITYTGPSATEVRAHISATSATGVTYTAGTGVIALASIPNSSITNSTITVTGDSGSTAIDLGDTLTVTGGSGLETSQSGDTLTIDVSADGINDTHIDFGTGANQVSTADIPEQTNLYYTDVRADARIAAANLTDLNDVSYSSPTTNHVLTWTGSGWEAAEAPGAAGGEANRVANVGGYNELFKDKIGVVLNFRTIDHGDNLSITQGTDTLTINTVSSPEFGNLKINSAPNTIENTSTNADIILAPNGTGTVKTDGDLLPNSDSTYDLGAVGTEWANAYIDAVTATNLTGTIQTGAQPNIVSIGAQTANLNMNNNKILNVTDPTSAQDAATKAYVDAQLLTQDTLQEITDNGATTTNTITANGFTTDGLTITDNNIRTTRSNDNIVMLPNGTGVVEMRSAVAMSTNKITGVGDPTSAQDAATKAYVDSALSSGTTIFTLQADSGSNDAVLTGDTIDFEGTINEIETVVTANKITFGLPDDVTISNNLTVDGNFTVNGTQTTVNVSTLEVSDSLIKLARDNESSDSLDIGFIGHYYDNGPAHAGLFRDASDNKFKMFTGYSAEPTTNAINTADPGFRLATLQLEALEIGATDDPSLHIRGSSISTVNTNQNLTLDTAGSGVIELNSITNVTGDVTLKAQSDLRFADSDSSNYVAFQAPATVASNITWTLPNADAGVSGYALVSNAAGTLSWAAAGATVTQDNSTNTDFNLYFASTTSGALTAVKYDGADLLFNPSTSTLTCTNFAGEATSAQYADLAEIYASDREYPAGTVVTVGGDAEITKAGPDTDYLAGVISTAPAYLMNSAADGEAVALVGRVPVRVVGSITKGMPVFATHNGCASSNGQGPLVGIALETNSDLGEKSVECLLKV